ncbi:MAG: archaellin/type IV pilin N-terminal domain-containing protein [Candidatus Aenigmatarchaeota archaeon]
MLKGISPLIATVLLIALTMTIAGIIATWASSFTQVRLEEIKSNTTEGCIGANLKVSNARIINGTGYFTLENIGTATLRDFKAYLFYSNPANDEVLNSSRCYWVANSSYTLANIILEPGDIYTFNFTNSSASPLRIRITAGNCPTATMTTTIS